MVICYWERIENRGQRSDGRVYWATAFAVSERISKKRLRKNKKGAEYKFPAPFFFFVFFLVDFL